MTNLDIESFVGEHVLNAVQYGENGNGIFSLDGASYEVVEDPDDGYRSYLDEIKVIEPVREMYSIPVFVVPIEDPDKVGIVFVDKRSEKPILTFGTDYYESYYPCYFFDYTPQNIAENGGDNQ